MHHLAQEVVLLLLMRKFTVFREPDKNDNISIYNGSNNNVKPFTMYEALSHQQQIQKDYPFDKTLWNYGINVTKNKLWFSFCFLFLQIIPALIIDVGLRLNGIQFRCV